jgi:hypothetical protein
VRVSPAPQTPQTPAAPPVSITIPSITPATTHPSTRVVSRRCARLRCRVTVAISDAGGLAGLRVAGTLRRVTGCGTRKQRRSKACRARAVAARRLTLGRFLLDARELRRGTYRLTIVAADADRTKQRRPTVVTLRVGR